MSVAAPYNFTVDRGSDWSKVLTLRDNNGDPVPITDIFTTAVSISGTTSPSVTAASLTYVSTDLWTSNGSASVPGSGTWIRVRRASNAWEITKWVNGGQVAGSWTSSTNPNHPAWVEEWVGADGATGEPEVDSEGMFFEGSVSLQERGPDMIPFEFTTVGDGTGGQVLISLSRSYTRALASGGKYRFDWFVYRGRKRSRLVEGRVTAQGSSTGTATGIPVPAFGNSPAVAWGSITGTLSNQTDLQAALDAVTGSGTNAITSATTSDGTANLSLSNVTTATAEVTDTLTAPHIHGNLAGSLYAHVRAAENLAKGDPVYVSGSHGSGATLIAEVSKADASNAAKMPAVGIMDAAVSANATGHMVISGTITELATNAYSINAELYVAAGGGMTATPPNERAQPVARVERSNANNGAILVKVNGLSASAATANTLVRRSSNGSASFGDINAASLTAANIEATSSLQTAAFESTGNAAFQGSVEFQTTDYAYGTGAAAAHRTALGSGATGDELFRAASPAAANQALGIYRYERAEASAARNSSNTGATQTDDGVVGPFAFTAGKRYLIDFVLTFSCGAGGFVASIGMPVTAMDAGSGSIVVGTQTTHTSTVTSITTAAANMIIASRTGSITSPPSIARGHLMIPCKTTGSYAFQWGQQTSDASNTILQTAVFSIREL